MLRHQLASLLGACIFVQVLGSAIPTIDNLLRFPKVGSQSATHTDDAVGNLQPLLTDTTNASIDEARRIVKASIAEMTHLNKARLDHPIREASRIKTAGNWTQRSDREYAPLLHITEEIAHAAAVVQRGQRKACYLGKFADERDAGLPDEIDLQSIKGQEEEEDAYGGYGFYESSFGALDTLLKERRPRNRSVGTKIATSDY